MEIASRVLCDIECHLRPGARDKSDAKAYLGSGCPGSPGKKVVRKYLAEALAKEGLFVRGGDGANSVYCKGSFYTQEGFVQAFVTKILGFLDGDGPDAGLFSRILGKILDLATLKTKSYLTEIMKTDRVVRTSVSVLICPVSPGSCYTLFGKHDSDGVMLIPAAASRLDGGRGAINRDLMMDKRLRYYCHMPALDTMPLAPYTYVRQLTKVFKKWVKMD